MKSLKSLLPNPRHEVSFGMEMALDDFTHAVEDVRTLAEYQERSLFEYVDSVEQKADQMEAPEAERYRQNAERGIRGRERANRTIRRLIVQCEAYREAAKHEIGILGQRIHYLRELVNIYAPRELEVEPYSREWWLLDMARCTEGSYTRTQYLLDHPDAQVAIYGHIRLEVEDYRIWQEGDAA